VLNRTLNDAVEKRQPVSKAGLRLKFFYATQVGQAPPTFLTFVNRDDLFSDEYTKYLSREMRRAFGFEGCPIFLRAKARPKTIEPKRKFATAQGARPPARARRQETFRKRSPADAGKRPRRARAGSARSSRK
jgi:hypothetical protein